MRLIKRLIVKVPPGVARPDQIDCIFVTFRSTCTRVFAMGGIAIRSDIMEVEAAAADSETSIMKTTRSNCRRMLYVKNTCSGVYRSFCWYKMCQRPAQGQAEG